MPELMTGGAPAPRTAGAEDRRAFVRYPCALDVSCQAARSSDDLWWNARVCDISLGGLGMALGRPFERGTVLEVEFQGAGGQWRRQQARVAHVERRDDGGWQVGCEFVERIGDDLLADLLLRATADFEAG
jgi:hypothetical protein